MTSPYAMDDVQHTHPAAATGLRRRPAKGGPRRGAGRGASLASTAVLLVASVYFLLPVWWLAVSSTKSAGSLFSSNGFWFGDWQIAENVKSVLAAEDGLFLTWMLNSALYAGVGGAIATLLAAACGYALTKYDFWGKGPAFVLIMAGVLVPNALLTVPLYLLFSRVGLINTAWAVLVPAVVNPFGVFLARIYAEASIPDEVIEAGRMDGAGEIRIFFTMGLRMMSSGLVTVFLFSFVAIWNNFFLPLVMLKDRGLYPVTVGIYSLFNANNEVPYAQIITASFLSVIPLVAAFILLQRFWRTGLTAGAVKA